MPVAPHANFDKMNGVIPGEGLTNPPGALPCQNPPQYVHLDELLESLWFKINSPNNTIQIYGLLKAGTPAEAIARTMLFGAFANGVCTVDLAQLALKTVVRQIVAIGHFLGLKKIKIRNHSPETVKQLAAIADAIKEFGDDNDAKAPTASASSGIFTGIGQ